MKLPLKYGLMITCVVVAWVLVTHFLFRLSPESNLNAIAPVLFNIAAIVAIYLGIIRKKEEAGAVTFKEGIKTGVAISFVYAVSACLFFFILLMIVGPSLLAHEPMARSRPLWQVAIGAFAGMFLGALILGLVYSTIISFFLAKRLRTN